MTEEKEIYILWVYPPNGVNGERFIEGIYAHKIQAKKDMRMLLEDEQQYPEHERCEYWIQSTVMNMLNC
jgi:hypothetical protein